MNINNLSVSQQTFYLLKRGMDAASKRSEAISNNLTNINTAGYKRHYITFEENLKNNIEDIRLRRTNQKHMKYGTVFGEIKEGVDTKTSLREDGNNVNVDQEMVNQSANTLMYNALISQANNRLSTTRYVLNQK